MRNASFLASEGDGNGTWWRFIPIITPQGPNNETGPSSAPANGGGPDVTNSSRNYLHVNQYPNTAGPGQTRECEAGNERFAAGRQSIGNLPGTQGTNTDEQTAREDGGASDGGGRRTAGKQDSSAAPAQGIARCVPA